MAPPVLLGALALPPLALAADRIGLLVAERIGSYQARRHIGFLSEPRISIRGFPFLTQLAAWRFKEIHVLGQELTQSGVLVSQVDLILYGARPTSTDRVHVERLGGTALVAFSDLLRAGLPELTRAGGRGTIAIVPAGEDLVTLTAGIEAPVLGLPLQARVTSRISLISGNRLQLQVVGLDRLTWLNQTAADRLSFTVPVSGLPFGLTFSGLRMVDDGVELQLAGQDTIIQGRPAAVSPVA